ncbi:GAF and ANTAR domain-containing protein [Amycolatopsis sp. NPDC021455]|uniref:GAF and ANTAR domain-containing protein n=1 Tax=Amycolatopsis sp. NPDC021455 TaxID=3154901 RepID=UPI0033C01DBE
MREDALIDALVELADALTDDFDLIDFLHLLAGRGASLLEADAAGVLLAHAHSGLQVVASADETPEVVELFHLQTGQGPGYDAWRTGSQVVWPDLRQAADRWPRLASAAATAGVTAAFAVPMRLRDESIGVLSLFRATAGEPDARWTRTAKALVDVATIGILQATALRRPEVLVEELQAAITSRVVLEQAKGFVSERLGVDLATAFTLLRDHARRHGLRLTDVARAVVTRRQGAGELLAGEPGPA